MKRVALISDIHGNFPALQAVLTDIDQAGVTQILCLGDIVGFFSMINECIDLLLKRNVLCLKGNHDHALVYDEGVIRRSKTCTQVLKKQINEIKPAHTEWLKTLTARLDVDLPFGSATLVHGGLEDPIDEYLYDVPLNYFSKRGFERPFFFHGHTHHPRLLKLAKVTCVNPGSVGQPRDGDRRSSYCMVGDGAIEFRRVAYDHEPLVADMRAKGYGEHVIKSLQDGMKVGGGYVGEQ